MAVSRKQESRQDAGGSPGARTCAKPANKALAILRSHIPFSTPFPSISDLLRLGDQAAKSLTMSSFVRTQYVQSKWSTQQLAEWLARSASEYGFPLSNFQPSRQPRTNDEDDAGRTAQQLSNARRNKQKKARQKAKKKEEAGGAAAEDEGGEEQGGQAQADAVSPPPQSSYTLKIRQLVEIAEFLVEKGASIPLHVMDMVESAIDGRLDTTRQFFSNPDASTSSHLYFIGVLSSVRIVFKEHLRKRERTEAEAKGQARSQPRVGSKASLEPKSSLENRFASLAALDSTEGEEEERADIQLPPPSRPAGVATSTMHLTFDVEQTKETALEMLALFFKDMHSVLDCTKQLWSEYCDGTVDLLTASVTANTALELLRRPHDDVGRLCCPSSTTICTKPCRSSVAFCYSKAAWIRCLSLCRVSTLWAATRKWCETCTSSSSSKICSSWRVLPTC